MIANTRDGTVDPPGTAGGTNRIQQRIDFKRGGLTAISVRIRRWQSCRPESTSDNKPGVLEMDKTEP